MHVAFLFHKDPLGQPGSIDLIRLRSLALALMDRGVRVTVVAPVANPGWLAERVPVVPLAPAMAWERYDVIKASYHYSLELPRASQIPLVCRLVRVVDERLPERDGPDRPRLMACQALAAQQASGMVFNNAQNARRWRERYGIRQRIAIVPNGCPERIPPPGGDPYGEGPPVLLFLGSLAAARMVELVNAAADRLRGRLRVHLVGRNKSRLYGGVSLPLSPWVVDRGELPEWRVWDYVRHARLGLALAAGPDPFDNDLSKILSYLRGGLPVLGEEGVLNLHWARQMNLCHTFRFGDADDLATRALALAAADQPTPDPAGMERLVQANGWRRRAEVLHRFLESVAYGRSVSGGG